MRRGLVWSLVGFIGIAALSLAATIAAGHKPLLGLDLRGGVSVVLKPQGTVDNATLQEAVSIIQHRVDGLGVANSDIARQGHDVVINLPGIKDSQAALKTLGQTAVLYFRPVYCIIPPYQKPASTKSPPATGNPPATNAPKALGPLSPGGTQATLLAAGSTAATTPATSTPSTTVPANGALSQADCSSSTSAKLPTTPVSQDKADATVILPSHDPASMNGDRYLLGPADMRGNVVSKATVVAPQSGGGYSVQLQLTSSGAKQFDAIAAKRYPYYQQNPNNPPPQSLEAIELDGVVQAAPTIQASSFHGVAEISGGKSAPFTAKQASDLALVLRYGSLPVRFTPQSVQTVSATVGKDSLEAGLLAGIGGIVVVLLYMIAYYRALGLVVVLGLAAGGSLLYVIITELSQTSSLALTLSGVTGIIVSIGITVDSYIVYFERLKDEVRAGRTIRSSVERSFTRAFRTVLTADLVSFFAALILYLLTVGDVRGFAFTLGLSTLLDVATAYFFIRPMVVFVGRHRTFTEARFLGVSRGLGVSTAGEVG